jgi:hypothetical protein
MKSYESRMKNIYCVQNSEFFNVNADGGYNYVLWKVKPPYTLTEACQKRTMCSVTATEQAYLIMRLLQLQIYWYLQFFNITNIKISYTEWLILVLFTIKSDS